MMPNNYLDSANQHQINLQRTVTALLSTNVYPSLDAAYKAARMILLESGEITSITQLNQITAAIKRTVIEITAPPWDDVTAQYEATAITEASFSAALIGGFNDVELSVPPEQKIIRYINSSLMSLSGSSRGDNIGVWSSFVKSRANENAELYNKRILAGYRDESSTDEIIKDLLLVTKGLMRSDAETLARTGLNHYATQANLAMAQDNVGIIDREVPSVTFDNSISSTCAGHGSRYGQRGWPVGKSPIGYPPYHFNCRTVIVFLVAGQSELEGTKASVGGQSGEAAEDAFKARKDRTGKKPKRHGRRDDNIFKPGQVNAKTQIDNWLARQPKYFIESTLGKSRAALFTRGGLSLSSFTDLTGRPLTLAQLQQLNSAAFSRAGL